MQKIILNNLDRIEFAKELKTIQLNEEIEFEITNALAKNFEILGYYLIKKSIKKIILTPNQDLDILIKRKFQIHIKQFFIYYSKFFIIKFSNLLDDEIVIVIGIKNYLHYCNKLNKTPKWNENFLKKEKRKIEENPKLLKYNSFKDCVNLLEKSPFSKLNIPTEEGKDRFVFYFYMYSEKQKEILFEFLKKYNLDKYELLISLINNNKINEEIYYYAFGFSYLNNELIRFTLYTKFDIELLKANKLNDFIFTKHEFKIESNYKNIWFYAVDFYNDGHLEFKFYDEPYFFDKILSNVEISNVFKNKKCVKVSKYKEKKLYTIKYEFEIQNNFNLEEQEILKKYELYNAKNQLLAIYLKENEIIHKVFYNL